MLLAYAWLLGQNQPAGRHFHCAVVYNGHMIVHGGRGVQQQQQVRGDVWSLNFDTTLWTQLLGVEGSTVRDFESVRGDWSEVPQQRPQNIEHPGERSSHACVMLRSTESDGELLMFGGLSGHSGEPQMVQNDTWKLLLKGRVGEAVSAEWQRVAVRGTAPMSRSGHSAVRVADGVLVYGGCEGGDVYHSSDVFGDLWLLHEAGAGTAEEPFSYKWVALNEPAWDPSRQRSDYGGGRALSGRNQRADQVPPLHPSEPGSAATVLTSRQLDLQTREPDEWLVAAAAAAASAPSQGQGPEAEERERSSRRPDARCAHTAAAFEGGMLISGGRKPRQASHRGSWQARGVAARRTA